MLLNFAQFLNGFGLGPYHWYSVATTDSAFMNIIPGQLKEHIGCCVLNPSQPHGWQVPYLLNYLFSSFALFCVCVCGCWLLKCEDYDHGVELELMYLFLKMLFWYLSQDWMINIDRGNIKSKLVLWAVLMVFKGLSPRPQGLRLLF